MKAQGIGIIGGGEPIVIKKEVRQVVLLQRNKQSMYYSNKGEIMPVYERDKDGNIVYIKVNGVDIPSETGEKEVVYQDPVFFKASISSKLHEALVRAFGDDDSSSYSQIVAAKGYLPFEIGTRIWRNSAFKYKPDGSVDENSADYEVRGVLNEGLNQDLFYLKVLVSEDEI